MTGIAQPTIARIESGLAVPRLDTFVRLLEACGETLISARAADADIDRAMISEYLRAIPPAERIDLLLEETTDLRRSARPRRKR